MTNTNTCNCTGGFASYSVLAYIVKKCQEKDVNINATKGQKLLYCCYGMILAAFKRRLTDETPRAWPYGPVFPSSLEWYRNRLNCDDAAEFVRSVDKEWLNVIDETLNYFMSYSAKELTEWSHLEGSPWSRASDDGENLYIQIPDRLIAEYFIKAVDNA